MNLPAFCIKRPAFTIVISLLLMIVGLISYTNLQVRWIPNISLPTVSINTKYPGASATLVEEKITKVIEDTLSGINGIDSIHSYSSQGSSDINLTFKLGSNLNEGIEELRTALDRVRGDLPRDIQNPVIMKSDSNDMPLLFISIYDPALNANQLSDYSKKYIKPVLETIDGIATIDIYGERSSAMRISLDPIKMAGANISIDDVIKQIQSQNTITPSGQIRGHDRYYSIVTDSALKTANQFNDLIIRENQTDAVRIKDIGTAKIEAENTDSAFRMNGKPAIAMAIIAQSTANPLTVEENIQSILKNLKTTLPKGMKLTIDYNKATYIKASMHNVFESFFEAIIFVWIVILIFLCSFRATFIPVITIPVCMISSFAILYLFNFSINTITLMAFVLAIGLVVDDAIVILENINRHIEHGLEPFHAALVGSREMIFPIIAMTLTLSAVYTPIAFTQGLLGFLFREFTFTLAGAVLISGLIALTLSPMMCSRLLQKKEHNTFQKWVDEKVLKLQHQYQKILTTILQKRKLILFGLITLIVLGGIIYKSLPAELAPNEDMNEIDSYVSGPHSASFEYTDKYAKALEKYYLTFPEVEQVFSIVGSPSHAFQIIKLKEKTKRPSIDDVIKKMNAGMNEYSGVRVNLSKPTPVLAEFAGGDDGDSLGLTIMTSGDFQTLEQVSEKVMAEIKKNSGFLHVDSNLKWDNEQFLVDIDREKAADLNVSIADITNTISSLIAGRTIGKANDIDIILQLNQSFLSDPNIFQKLFVPNAKGEMIPLTEVIMVRTITLPKSFQHYDRLRSNTIYLTLDPSLKLAKAVDILNQISHQLIPHTMKFSFTGEAKSFLESNGKTIFTFLLALTFIYLVLVAQFESFVDPFIILLTVPFAVIGAFVTLKLFGGSLNIYSNIGLITLIGLISKHGILITEFANRLRITGKSINEAIIQASLLRLRPILMTTAAMILGAFPLIIGSGLGSESRVQIGLVITGGMLFGTFFSLIVVPVAYTYFAPFRKLKTE